MHLFASLVWIERRQFARCAESFSSAVKIVDNTAPEERTGERKAAGPSAAMLFR